MYTVKNTKPHYKPQIVTYDRRGSKIKSSSTDDLLQKLLGINTLHL